MLILEKCKVVLKIQAGSGKPCLNVRGNIFCFISKQGLMYPGLALNLCSWACSEVEHYDRKGIGRRAIHLVISKTQGEETGRGQGMMEHAPSDLLLPIRPHLLKFLLLPQIATLARDQAFNISGLGGHFTPKP